MARKICVTHSGEFNATIDQYYPLFYPQLATQPLADHNFPALGAEKFSEDTVAPPPPPPIVRSTAPSASGDTENPLLPSDSVEAYDTIPVVHTNSPGGPVARKVSSKFPTASDKSAGTATEKVSVLSNKRKAREIIESQSSDSDDSERERYVRFS